MLQDRYGNQMSTSSDVARDAYIEGVDHILAATHGAIDAFNRAIEADPAFALGHIGMARALMYASDMAGAKASVDKAVSLKDGLSAREQRHIDIFALLMSGKPVEARSAVWAHVKESPRDAIAAQLNTNVFGLIGFSGLAGREAELLAYTSYLSPHYGEDWWMMSMHSLSLCETGQAAPALALMERALDQNPRNANGSHFKAHEQYELGDATAGLEYLRGWMTDYDKRSLLHGHLSWHEALWALQLGQIDQMWDTIDTAVAPGASDSMAINVLTDTAAIYWRADLAGVEVAPERWRVLSDYAAKHFPKSGQSFADIHAALAHAMAGDGERLAILTETANGFAGDLVAPISRAWKSVAGQDWQTALQELVPAMADHARLGGSRAQRDLLELTCVNVLLKLGRSDEAKRMMQMRRPIFAERAPVQGFAAA